MPVLTAVTAAAAVLTTAATATIAPYVPAVTTTSAQIRWEGAGELFLGDSTTPAVTVTSDGMSIATLTGLQPDHEYRYRVGDEVQGFQTLPLPGSPVRFAVIGDTRTNPDIYAELASAIVDYAPDFVVNTGDLGDDGRVGVDWESFFAAGHPLLSRVAFLAAVGNHDERGIFNAGDWSRYFPYRAYAVTAGDVRLIFIDTTVPFDSGTRQHAWIAAQLAEAQAARDRGEIDWIVAAHHFPAFSSGHHGGDPDVQRELLPMYRAAGVDLVLSGHDHIYDRCEDEGITYIVSGGGGAPLYPITRVPQSVVAKSVNHWMRLTADSSRLRAEAVDLSGNVIDRFELTPNRLRPEPPAKPSETTPVIGAMALLLGTLAVAWWGSGRLAA